MKKIVKISAVIALVLALVMIFTACDLFKPSEETFSGNGFSITLNSSFVEKELASMTAYYESQKVIVTVLKEELSLFSGYDVDTLNDYAELVISANSLENVDVLEKDGLVYFEYEKSTNGKDFKYLATVHKGSDAFWLVQFASESKNYDTLRSDMEGYAKSFLPN